MFKTVNEINQYKKQIGHAIRSTGSKNSPVDEAEIFIPELNQWLSFIIDPDTNDLKISLMGQDKEITISKVICLFKDLNYFSHGQLMEESVDHCFNSIFITLVSNMVKTNIPYIDIDILKSGKFKGIEIKNTEKSLRCVVTSHYEIKVWEVEINNVAGGINFNPDQNYCKDILHNALVMALIYHKENWDVNVSV